jgi:hypothetical protein
VPTKKWIQIDAVEFGVAKDEKKDALLRCEPIKLKLTRAHVLFVVGLGNISFSFTPFRE